MLSSVLHPERRVVLARELTKKFETITAHIASALKELSLEERGEYVVIVDRQPPDAEIESADTDPQVARWLVELLKELPPARAAAIAAKASGQSKQAIYALALRLKSA